MDIRPVVVRYGLQASLLGNNHGVLWTKRILSKRSKAVAASGKGSSGRSRRNQQQTVLQLLGHKKGICHIANLRSIYVTFSVVLVDGFCCEVVCYSNDELVQTAMVMIQAMMTEMAMTMVICSLDHSIVFEMHHGLAYDHSS